MEARSIFRYIWFGTALRYLQDAAQGWGVHGDSWILYNMTAFLGYLDEFGLVVTARAAYKLRKMKERLEKQPQDHRLTQDEAKELSDIMDEVRQTLEAEAGGLVAFIVSDKRVDVNKLLHRVGGLLAPGVFNALPDLAKYNFEEAGKCIAFERPTAAAFHLLRATEAVLRHLYCTVVRRQRVTPYVGTYG